MTSLFFNREQPPAETKETTTTQGGMASTVARRTLCRNKHLSDIEPSQTLKVIGIEENMEMYMALTGQIQLIRLESLITQMLILKIGPLVSSITTGTF